MPGVAKFGFGLNVYARMDDTEVDAECVQIQTLDPIALLSLLNYFYQDL